MAEKSKVPEILTACRFYIGIHLDGSDERIDAYFMECQGFKRSQDVIEHVEVTPQKWGSSGASRGRVVRTKIPGNSKSNNITLKRGMFVTSVLWEWFAAVEAGKWTEQRRDGDIVIYDQADEESARFQFFGAWPVTYKIGDLKAGSTEFQVEEMELAVDEFLRVTKQ
ncbi:phage tail protein [Leptolyngbya sp. PCC 6406]|uniref:phage tail protein n=1 Tax=Leptolyngbya sp. PCC 6406 TaxID=1173264 RepID=UPI0002ABA34E|nr:phage tail protein [Leptolyngbya sp. PCC 6406]